MTPETRDKLLRVGGKRIVAALAQHGVTDRVVESLPVCDPFAGPASLTIESCRAGSVLVGDAADRMLERLRQRGIAGSLHRASCAASRSKPAMPSCAIATAWS